MTGNAGAYTLVNLQPNIYTLTVEKAGFQKAIFTGVNVTAGEVVPLNAKLLVGRTSLGNANFGVSTGAQTQGDRTTAHGRFRVP